MKKPNYLIVFGVLFILMGIHQSISAQCGSQGATTIGMEMMFGEDVLDEDGLGLKEPAWKWRSYWEGRWMFDADDVRLDFALKLRGDDLLLSANILYVFQGKKNDFMVGIGMAENLVSLVDGGFDYPVRIRNELQVGKDFYFVAEARLLIWKTVEFGVAGGGGIGLMYRKKKY